MSTEDKAISLQQSTVYFAGGCLWGVQEFMKHVPGVVNTQAGRANGSSNTTEGEYDGYAECVKVIFNPEAIVLEQLFDSFFEIIDPTVSTSRGKMKEKNTERLFIANSLSI